MIITLIRICSLFINNDTYNNDNDNDNDNDKDLYSVISVGLWRFTTEQFKHKFCTLKKITPITKHKYIKAQVKNSSLKIKSKSKD